MKFFLKFWEIWQIRKWHLKNNFKFCEKLIKFFWKFKKIIEVQILKTFIKFGKTYTKIVDNLLKNRENLLINRENLVKNE